MSLVVSIARGVLTTQDLDRTRRAYDVAAAKLREQGITPVPTALDLRSELRRVGEHLSIPLVRQLATLARIRLADSTD